MNLLAKINKNIPETLEFKELLSARLCNIFAAISLCTICLSIFLNMLIDKDIYAYYVNFTFMIIAITALVLNYYQYFKIAQFVIIVVPAILATILLCTFGQLLFAEPIYLILILGAILFFNFRRSILIIIFILVCYFFEKVYLIYNDPLLPYNINISAPYLYFLGSAFFIGSLTYYLLAENYRYIKLIKQQNKRLETVNKELEVFTQIASHDLQSPLRNISSFSGLALKKIDQKDYSNVPDYLKNIESSVYKMNALMEDLKLYLKINTTHAQGYVKTDLNKVANKAINSLHTTIVEKNAEIIVEELPTMLCDPNRFEIMFQNIIQNALKYNRNKPIIKISANQNNYSIILLFQDNGIGIADDYKEKIFEHFVRLHREEEFSGTGLGLSICKQIINAMNGKLSVESTVGKGSVFIVTLPNQGRNTINNE